MKLQVLTTMTWASSGRSVSTQPAWRSRPSMSSLSTWFLAHPRLTRQRVPGGRRRRGVAAGGVIIPPAEYLPIIHRICRENDILLIFDEVITGFRVAYGGAQALYGVLPDLTCLGKIIGGGLPVGAYGGRAEIMDMVAPQGPVYQAGTLSGNPLAVAAGLATLKLLKDGDAYRRLEVGTARLVNGLKQAAEDAGLRLVFNRVGSMFSIFFTGHRGPERIVDFETASLCDVRAYAAYFWRMIREGVYFAPSQFESAFVSLAHTDEDLERTVEAAAAAFKAVGSS